MKIFAAAISILCVVIDQKATVQGGLFDIFRGKDKTPDEASGEGSGGFSGGLSGNLKLPGNILSECSVGGNVNGNIGASPSGGIQGDVNAEVNLPSCDCIRKFDAQGSVGGEGSAGFGGFGVSGGASFGGSLAMPGVNCAETDNPPEEEPNEEQDPSEEQESSEDENSPEEEEVDVTTLPLCADLRKHDLQGSLGSTDTSNKVAPGNRNKDNVFEKISVIIPGVNCYEPEPPEKESEESTEAPEESEESEQSTVAPKESEESEQSTDVYGESEKSEESTEAPEESEESEQSTAAPEELEESEQSTDVYGESEESEESTETPEESKESEQSTEAPEKSEESEQSTEAPEESEESEQSTEAPEELEESEESTEAPGKNSYCYRLDINRDIIMSPKNNFLTASPVENADAPAEFYQTMNMDNALQIYQTDLSLDKKLIYDSKPEKKMTNICNDSYPEGSIEANIWKIINLEVMAGKGCPVKKGSGYTFPEWLRGTELTLNEPLEYGNYKLNIDFDTPQGAWALKLLFLFEVNENSECTVKESFDEPTEAPEESEESEQSTEAPEESEESEEESEQCYIVDMDVQVVKIPIFMGVLNKPMDKDNAFKINGADMKVDGKFIYDSRSEEEMTNACEDSYPEGSFQANIWHMFNLGILKGKGCPVEQGSIKTFPKKLDDMQLKINERLEPGDYTAHLDLAAPDGTWAGAIYFYFMLDGPSECREEEEPQEPIKPFEDESNSNCYKVDIRRSTLLTPENNFLNSSEPSGDVTAEFYQTMDMENALQFHTAELSVNLKSIYDSKKMKNVCDDSYPEGSFEANIWKIFNLSIMNGQGCPMEKGDNHTFIEWLRGTELNFNDPLEYGNYRVQMEFDTPEGEWVLGMYLGFVVDENSMCNRS